MKLSKIDLYYNILLLITKMYSSEKVIFYIGDELSNETIIKFIEKQEQIKSNNNIYTMSNVCIHRNIPADCMMYYNNTIIKLLFNILEKLF